MPPLQPVRRIARIVRRAGSAATAARTVADETPVALSYGGTTHAVMMATPSDLEDFAFGFSLTEGVVSAPGEIEQIEAVTAGEGIDLQVTLSPGAGNRFSARRRHLAGPVGCGLCGIESIAEALRDVPSVAGAALRLDADDILSAARQLTRRQRIHRETGAVHAAGFYLPATGLVEMREDVGRHNALDKLAGALARQGVDGSAGAVIVTSRVSVEMVQKAAVIGAPVIAAISAPTALAVRTAERCGMTLIALLRDDGFEIFTHPQRIASGAAFDVA